MVSHQGHNLHSVQYHVQEPYLTWFYFFGSVRRFKRPNTYGFDYGFPVYVQSCRGGLSFDTFYTLFCE